MRPLNLARLRDLILARLALPSEKKPTLRAVSKDLYAIVARQLSKADWDRLLERELAALQEAGWVTAPEPPGARGQAAAASRGRAGKAQAGARGSTARATGKKVSARSGAPLGRGARSTGRRAAPGVPEPTKAGRAHLKAAFASGSGPRARSWREFQSQQIPRLLFPRQAAKRQPPAAVALLALRLGVELEGLRDTESVVDAWLRVRLGLPAGKAVTLDEIRAVLLARELGLSLHKSLAQVAGVAAAYLSGATSSDDDAVSDALTLRWLLEETPVERAAAPRRRAEAPPIGSARVALPSLDPVAPPALPLRDQTPVSSSPVPLARIAAKALDAAAGPEARHFGPNKVFIGSVWRALANDPEIAALGERAFKRQLVEAHRKNLLVLSRADLVAAMDPIELAASEIIHQNATYHFISRGASA